MESGSYKRGFLFHGYGSPMLQGSEFRLIWFGQKLSKI